MAVSLTVNGTAYSYPSAGEPAGWGAAATNWASAVTSGMLQKAGGSFTLTAEVDFGATYGLKSAYFTSRNGSPASAGIIRLGNAEDISWRNNADSANLDLNANSSDRLEFDGNTVAYLSEVQASDTFIEQADTPANFTSAANQVLKVNSGETAVEFGALVNANVDASAAIAYSKLAALTASRALVSDGSGFVSASSVTSTELGYVSGVTSAIQTQFAAKAGTALSNLSSVAINTSLISDTNNTDDLGSDSIEWKDIFVHSIKHGDGTNANLSISTTSDNGDIDLSAHGTGKVAISSPLEVTGTDTYVKIPSLTTTQRDALSAAAGQIIYNSTTGTIQAYTSSWGTLATATTATATTQGLTTSYAPLVQAGIRTIAAIADFTFTSGDVSGDVITETSHGMETGDKVQFSTSAADLPAGLSTSTDYWVIKLSANTFSVASSLANAVAGTAVTLSDGGSGTHTCEHQEEFSILDDDGYKSVEVTTGTNNLTIVLPTLADNVGRRLCIRKVDSGSGHIVIDGEGSEAIGSSTTFYLVTQYGSIDLEAGGTRWEIVGGKQEDPVYIRDEKSSGTAGGTATSGSRFIRTLNTTAGNTALTSLSSNQFTLQPGTYEVEAHVPGYFVNGHKAWLWNDTDGADIIIGTTVRAEADQTYSHIYGTFTLTASKACEILHRVQSTNADDGQGQITSFTDGNEVYTIVKITKLLV